MIVKRAALEAALDALDALEGQVGDTKTVIDDAKSSSALSTARSRLKVVASRLLANRFDATKQC